MELRINRVRINRSRPVIYYTKYARENIFLGIWYLLADDRLIVRSHNNQIDLAKLSFNHFIILKAWK